MARPPPVDDPTLITNVSITDNRLGEGAYGTVVEVRWNGLSCAGKRLHEKLDLPQHFAVDYFRKECLTWSKLRHPHIAQFFGTFKENPSDTTALPILVIEKMDSSLTELLRLRNEEVSHSNIPFCIRVRLLEHIALALVYLHSLRYIHRDVTPNNVLVDLYTMTAKLTDFGMAKALGKGVTTMTVGPGGPAFMPPEASTTTYDTSLDIFSSGCVIISVLVCQWPTPGPPSKTEGGNLVAISEFDRRKEYIDQFSSDAAPFEPIVRSTLENEPNKRPSSETLAHRIQNIKKSIPKSDNLHFLEQRELLEAVEELRSSQLSNEEELQKYKETVESTTATLQEKDKEIDALQIEMDHLKRQSKSRIAELVECHQKQTDRIHAQNRRINNLEEANYTLQIEYKQKSRSCDKYRLDSCRLREERDSCVNLLRKHNISESDIHCNRKSFDYGSFEADFKELSTMKDAIQCLSTALECMCDKFASKSECTSKPPIVLVSLVTRFGSWNLGTQVFLCDFLMKVYAYCKEHIVRSVGIAVKDAKFVEDMENSFPEVSDDLVDKDYSRLQNVMRNWFLLEDPSDFGSNDYYVVHQIIASVVQKNGKDAIQDEIVATFLGQQDVSDPEWFNESLTNFLREIIPHCLTLVIVRRPPYISCEWESFNGAFHERHVKCKPPLVPKCELHYLTPVVLEFINGPVLKKGTVFQIPIDEL